MQRTFVFRILLLALVLLSACELSDEKNAFRLLADFDEDEKIYLVNISQTYIVELIVTLSQYERVGVLVQSLEEVQEVEAVLLQAGAVHLNLSFGVFSGVDQWIRDSAPAILKKRNGELRAVSFLSSKKYFASNPSRLAESLGIPFIQTWVNIQGGARESNGEGLVILTESFFRNTDPGFRKREIHRELKRKLGLRKIIWLPEGLIEDEPFENGPVFGDIRPLGLGGHVDEFCRFTDPETVLLAQVAPADLAKHPLYQINEKRLEESFRILKKERKLNIIRVLAAEMIFDSVAYPSDGMVYPVVLVASYLNFVVGNEVAIAARYFRPGMPFSVKEKDERMYRILQEQFPDKKIIQLDPRRLNARGGGFHCVTFNFPAKRSAGKKVTG